MARKYQNKGLRCKYDQDDLQRAIKAVKQGIPLRKAARMYNVPASTVGKHYKRDKLVLGGGRKPELSAEDELSLCRYLKACCEHGAGLTMVETLTLVHEFCKSECARPTRWSDKPPTYDWFRLFLNRHPELRIRKGENLCKQRVRGADPFTVQQFFKEVEDTYNTENIKETDGFLIYNCDETSFSHDPSAVKVVAVKGTKRVSTNIAGTGKTNTTVLACCGADGSKMPPFIIFKGKHVWSSWIPADEYPGTAYAAQKNGWMDGELFVEWFRKIFVPNMPDKNRRGGKKVILFFDGVGFHISIPLIKLALEHEVVLVKLPPNLSHHLQPLDKTVFKPLKTGWDVLLTAWNRKNPGVPLKNVDLGKHLKLLWEDYFVEKNAISGFKSTGLFPVDSSKFPREAYDPIKLARFNAHDGDAATTTATPSGEDPDVTTSVENPQPSTSRESTTPVGIDVANYIPPPSRFEEFIRFKLTEMTDKAQPTAVMKRKRLTVNTGEILTKDEVLQRLQSAEKAKSTKKIKVILPKKRPVTKKVRGKKGKPKSPTPETESEESWSASDFSDCDSVNDILGSAEETVESDEQSTAQRKKIKVIRPKKSSNSKK